MGGAHDGDGPHAGHLSGDDVHDDAGRVDGLAARHVDPGARDGLPSLLDDGSVGGPRDGRCGDLRPAAGRHPDDRLLEGLAHQRVELVDGGGDGLGRHAERLSPDTVEAFGLITQCVRSALPHAGDQLGGRVGHDRDVRPRTGDEVEQVGVSRVASAKVCRLDHGRSSLVMVPSTLAPIVGRATDRESPGGTSEP
nr:hypothetical protein GCM10025699_54620 [Microbacterium flavescens]